MADYKNIYGGWILGRFRFKYIIFYSMTIYLNLYNIYLYTIDASFSIQMVPLKINKIIFARH